MFLRHLLLITFCTLGGLVASISPSSPIIISSTGDLSGQVAVAGNSTGFVAAWVRSGNVYSSFSSNGGLTWGIPFQVSNTSAANDIPSIAANSNGFAISWVNTPPGSSGSAAYVNFSSDGLSWSSDALVNTTNGDTPVRIGANGEGFVVAFRGSSGQIAYANFSSDGTTWSNTGSVVLDSSKQSWLPFLPCVGSSEGFMVLFSRITMLLADLATPFSTTGTSWPSVGTIPSTSVPFAQITALALANSSSDFLAGWLQEDVLKSSSTVNNGDVWSEPIDISNNLNISSPTFSGITGGFIAGWIEGGTTGNVTLTEDLGVTWATPVEIPGATFNTSTINSGSFDSTVLFTWVDGAQNAVVSRVVVSGAALPNPTGKESFFKVTEPNHPGGGLFR